jgi:hypothetical protein
MEKVWSYITFLRDENNKPILDLFCDYIDTRLVKRNKNIMEVLDKLCKIKYLDIDVDPFIKELKQDIDEKNRTTVIHVNSNPSLKYPKQKTVKRVIAIPKKDPEYLFDGVDDSTATPPFIKNDTSNDKIIDTKIPIKKTTNKFIPTKKFTPKKNTTITNDANDPDYMF